MGGHGIGDHGGRETMYSAEDVRRSDGDVRVKYTGTSIVPDHVTVEGLKRARELGRTWHS